MTYLEEISVLTGRQDNNEIFEIVFQDHNWLSLAVKKLLEQFKITEIFQNQFFVDYKQLVQRTIRKLPLHFI